MIHPYTHFSKHLKALNKLTLKNKTTKEKKRKEKKRKEKAMDWFSWLTKTNLEPSLVYEYGLTFAHNELEEDDIHYFNHEFLQSMGISIAKHRLEILKLARKERGSSAHHHPVARVLVAIKRTRSNLAKYLRTWVLRRGQDSSAIVVVPRPAGYSSRWRGAMLKRNKKMMLGGGGGGGGKQSSRLLLTNGSFSSTPMIKGPRLDHSFSTPVIFDVQKDDRKLEEGDEDDEDDDDGYWSTGVEEIRWDTMFQNLKPT